MPIFPCVRTPTVRPGTGLTRGIAVTALAGVAVAMGCAFAVSAAAAPQPPVGLGAATGFAVLAGSGITNTGPTTVNADVGTYATTSETGFGSVTFAGGTNHDGDAVTQSAKTDLGAAYGDAARRTPATSVPVELGGTTLGAGVYTSPTFGLTGTLTLDASGDPDAEFIFQAGTTLTTASNSHVLLIGGANACNVVWQIGSSATFGIGADFTGNLLAADSITATTGATFEGRLLAEAGAVTLDTNTITTPTCPVIPPVVTPTTPIAPTPQPAAGGSATVTATPAAAPTPTATADSSPTPTATVAGPAANVSAVMNAAPAGGAAPAPAENAAAVRHVLSTPASDATRFKQLPRTGLPTLGIASAGLLLITLGALLMGIGRKRCH